MVPKAVHLNGGNYFDKMLIAIEESIRVQDEWLKSVEKKSIQKNKCLNYLNLKLLSLSVRFKLHETLVMLGIKRKWFDEFVDYWKNCLVGRSINIMDFHHLHFNYRTKSQYMGELTWETTKDHLANWQTPNNIASIFCFIIKYSLRPVWEARLPEILKPGMKVLEYGCGLAPMYRTYRAFFNHIETEWYLADIPNFPLHYARHVYGKDKEVKFICITEEKLDDPLKNIGEKFDLIIIQEVFEHLHKPKFIAEYLLDILKLGGLFYFNYMISDAKGHDTPAGREERIATLKYLMENLEIISGSLYTDGREISTCIGVKN